ncbi:MAG: AMP-binding protein, partial [Halochromatium sp.]
MSSEHQPLSEIRVLVELIPLLRARGDAIALVELEREQRRDWSAASLAEQAQRLAAGLRSEGLEPSNRVLLYAPNS